MNDTRIPVFGIAGWKNSGKTTLVESLVFEFVRRGLSVSTIKHAHHNFNLDQEGTDSNRHHRAGAREVALVSPRKWALMHEIGPESTEPGLETMVAKMSECDLILAEGFKASAINKIETIRSSAQLHPPLWQTSDSVIAVATDTHMNDCPKPQFDLDDIGEIADFIMKSEGLTP